MAEMLAPSIDKATSKKKRKTAGNANGATQSSKRQKIVASSPAPPRTLLKTSPVPYPTDSPSPPDSSRTTAEGSGVIPTSKKTQKKAASAFTNGSATTTSTPSLKKKTPILPPPMSPREPNKSASSKKRNVETVASKSSVRRSTSPSEQATTNGTSSKPSLDTSLPEDAKKKEKKSAAEKQRKRKAKIKDPSDTAVSSIETSRPIDIPNDTQRREKTHQSEMIDDHPQNVANLDPSNDIAGRELPQSAGGPAEQPPETPVERKKKKKKTHERAQEDFTDSLEPLKDASEQLPVLNTTEKKKKHKDKPSRDEQTQEQHQESVPIPVGADITSSMALIRIKQNRDIIKQNINVSRDFGLEGALSYPSGPDYNTGFHLFEVIMYLSVPPLGSGYPLQAAVNLGVSQYLFNYYPPAKGILICHTNHKICPPPQEAEASLTRISDGYADNNLWVSADLYIFRPTKGAWLRGNISLQHESHIAVMIMGHWPASVARKRLPKSWRWVADDDDGASLIDDDDDVDAPSLRLGGAGYWSDGAGNPVMGQVIIRALDFDVVTERAGGTVLSIEGSMLDEEDDKEANLIDELSVPQIENSNNRLLTAPTRELAAITAGSSEADDTDAMDVDAAEMAKISRRADYKKKRLGAGRTVAQ